MRILVFLMLAAIASPAYSQITIGRYRVNGTIEFNADLQIEEVVPMTTIPDPVAFWKASDLTSEYGSFDLTNNNGVTFNTGKIGNAAYVVRSTNSFLSHANDAAFRPNGDFTVTCWYYPNGSPGLFQQHGIISLGNTSGVNIGWTVFHLGSLIRGGVSQNGTGISLTTGLTPTNATWNFIALRYDSTTGTTTVNVNGSSQNSSPSGAGNVFATTSPLNIGSMDSSSSRTADGRFDAAGIWHSRLSDAQITALYNGGDGLELPIVTNATSFIPTYGTPALALATYGTSAAPIATMGVSKQ